MPAATSIRRWRRFRFRRLSIISRAMRATMKIATENRGDTRADIRIFDATGRRSARRARYLRHDYQAISEASNLSALIDLGASNRQSIVVLGGLMATPLSETDLAFIYLIRRCW